MPLSIPAARPIRIDAVRIAILSGLLAIGSAFSQAEPRPPTPSPGASSPSLPSHDAPSPAASSRDASSRDEASPDTSSSEAGMPYRPPLDVYRPDASSTWNGIGTAVLWSVGATALPIWAGAYMIDKAGSTAAFPGAVLILGGMAAGPSAGQWSLGSGLQGAVGALIRIPGMIVTMAGFVQSINAAFCGMDFGGDSDDSRCPQDDGTGTIKAGMVIYLAGTVYSLIDIPFAAQRKQERQPRYGLAPFLLPGAGGGTSQGLMAWARF